MRRPVRSATLTTSRPAHVLHAPVEVAGQLALSAFGLRELGIESRAFARLHPFRYPVAPDVVPGPTRLDWIRAAVRTAPRFDVVHFYFGQSFLPEPARGADVRALRHTGRRVVVEFLGSDVRMPSVEAARNPDYVPLPGEDDAVAERRMRRWSALTDGHAIICDPALAAFAERHFTDVHVVPFRIDARTIVPAPPDPSARRPVIVHAPSDLRAKGTDAVRAAIEVLDGRGATFEYVELHGMSQREAAMATRRADLVIDQLRMGSHGVFAVEAMCMAKPVVCNVRPELVPAYPDGFPIVGATPDTLADVLANWIERPRDRRELGLASRAYAERVHDVRVVARRLLDVYAQLPTRRAGR